MAAPSAPAKPTVRPGPEPNSLWVYGNDVAAATYYRCYFHYATGVNAAVHSGYLKCGTNEVPQFLLRPLPFWNKIFVALTAFNVGDEESAASTENSFPLASQGD